MPGRKKTGGRKKPARKPPSARAKPGAEFRLIHTTEHGVAENMVSRANALARDGWRLVSVTHRSHPLTQVTYLEGLFKREKGSASRKTGRAANSVRREYKGTETPASPPGGTGTFSGDPRAFLEHVPAMARKEWEIVGFYPTFHRMAYVGIFERRS
jgi:hypothetical protein